MSLRRPGPKPAPPSGVTWLHPSPHEFVSGVCICPCAQCTDHPVRDATRCVCRDCDVSRCGAREGVETFGQGVSAVGGAS